MPDTLNVIRNDSGMYVLEIRKPLTTKILPIGKDPAEVQRFLLAMKNNALPEYFQTLKDQASDAGPGSQSDAEFQQKLESYSIQREEVISALTASNKLFVNGKYLRKARRAQCSWMPRVRSRQSSAMEK